MPRLKSIKNFYSLNIILTFTVMKVKKVGVVVKGLVEYIQLHKGIMPLTDVECKIVAAILQTCPSGNFGKKDKAIICKVLKENNSYLNVYIERMLEKRAILPNSSGYSVNPVLIPSGENALMILYENTINGWDTRGSDGNV